MKKRNVLMMALLSLTFVKCSNFFDKSNNENMENKNVNSAPINNTTENNSARSAMIQRNSCDKNEIIGIWVSNEDNTYKLILDSNYFINSYPGGKDTMPYVLSSKIASVNSNKKEESCYISAQDSKLDITYEYEIVSVSKETLTLMSLDRGNLLIFTKGKSRNGK